jgi:dockerin type I repeat protein
MPPLPGSPAIDSGSNSLHEAGAMPLTTDQRGLPRISGGLADRGAAEYQWLAGDVNKDGSVGFSDLLQLAQSYGQSGKTWAQGDLTGDGSVNFADLLILAHDYGQVASPTSALARASDPLSIAARHRSKMSNLRR